MIHPRRAIPPPLSARICLSSLSPPTRGPHTPSFVEKRACGYRMPLPQKPHRTAPHRTYCNHTVRPPQQKKKNTHALTRLQQITTRHNCLAPPASCVSVVAQLCLSFCHSPRSLILLGHYRRTHSTRTMRIMFRSSKRHKFLSWHYRTPHTHEYTVS